MTAFFNDYCLGIRVCTCGVLNKTYNSNDSNICYSVCVSVPFFQHKKVLFCFIVGYILP